MQVVLIYMMLALSAAVTVFGNNMMQLRHAQHARIVKAQLDPALAQAITDAETSIVTIVSANDTATGNGVMAHLPNAIVSSANPCVVSDTANAQESDCAGVSVQRTLTFTGYTNISSPAGGTTESLGNVNVDTVGVLPVQREITTQISLDRIVSGITDGHRDALAHFTVVTSCANAQTCAAQIPVYRVTFNGFRDAASSHESRGSDYQVNGKCGTTASGCTTGGNDVGSTVNPNDSRIVSQALCYDAGFIGNGGTHSGDLCNQTGNTASGPQQTSSYAQRTLTNSGAPVNGYAK